MTHPTEQPDGAHGECATDDLVKRLRDEPDHPLTIDQIYAAADRIEQQASRIAELSAALDGARTVLAEIWTPNPGVFRELVQHYESIAKNTLLTLPDVSAAVAAIEAREDGMAHEIWSASQLAPGEGIEDGVARIKHILARLPDVSAHVAAIEARALLAGADRCHALALELESAAHCHSDGRNYHRARGALDSEIELRKLAEQKERGA